MDNSSEYIIYFIALNATKKKLIDGKNMINNKIIYHQKLNWNEKKNKLNNWRKV